LIKEMAPKPKQPVGLPMTLVNMRELRCAGPGRVKSTRGRIETLNDFYASQVKQRSSGL
jgi:hypothetical protein